MEYGFDAKKVTADIIEWIRGWFRENGEGCSAVIGISGGKDSSVTAALCAAALGRERVVGVMMPNGVQPDIDYSKKLIEHLGIRSVTVTICTSVTYFRSLTALRQSSIGDSFSNTLSAFSIRRDSSSNTLGVQSSMP